MGLGQNNGASLGIGSSGNRLSPVQIGSNFASIAPGNGCSYGIKSDSSLWAWGAGCGTSPFLRNFLPRLRLGVVLWLCLLQITD